MSGKFACPKCGSENIQKCSVIYQQGTVGHSYTTRSGDYSAETSGVESTELARSVAPPSQKSTNWGWMIVVGFFTAAAFAEGHWIIGIVLALATVGLFQDSVESSDYNNKQWPRDYRAWENSYLCYRCGHYFQLKD